MSEKVDSPAVVSQSGGGVHQPLALQTPYIPGGFYSGWNPYSGMVTVPSWIHPQSSNPHNMNLHQPKPKSLASPSSASDFKAMSAPPADKNVNSPVAISSPKPVNCDVPGFLLGSRRESYERGFHAFSPYPSRTGTPASSINQAASIASGVLSTTDKQSSIFSISDTAPVDMTLTSKQTEGQPEEKKSEKESKPVGIAVGRQRDRHKSDSKSRASPEKKSGRSISTANPRTSGQTTPANPPTSFPGGWPGSAGYPNMPYPNGSGYQPYAMQPFYMMHPAPVGYMCGPPHQPHPFMLPSLDIPKSTQVNTTNNAGTSPSKSASVSGSSMANSPKSPLDKARERLQEIEENARKQSKALPSPLTKEEGHTFPGKLGKDSTDSEVKSAPTSTSKPAESANTCNIVSTTVEYRQEEDYGSLLEAPVQKKSRTKKRKRQSKNMTHLSTDEDSDSEIDPVTISYEQKEYKVSHRKKDLLSLESKLKLRLKALNKQTEKHSQVLKDLSSRTNNSKLESQTKKHPTDQSPQSSSAKKAKLNPLGSFNVLSKTHPSLKMKAAAKAKAARAKLQESSTSDFEAPGSLSISIPLPNNRPECRKLVEEELSTTHSLILMNIDGLFYESHIKEIDPPNIYGIIIDGERHSKPRIFTQEELLNNAYTNVKVTRLSELTIGCRVCAYWSELFGCLYPGTVTEIYPSKSTNTQHLIDIEFDDGDSGKFPLRQMRLLPKEYPHTKYDSSTVIPVGRRRSTLASQLSITSPPAKQPRASAVTAPRGRGRPRKNVAVSEEEVFTSGEDHETDASDSEMTIAPTLEWSWSGEPTRKQARGRGRKDFYQCMTRGDEIIKVGDCAVFQSMGANSLPYIGEILSMWEGWSGKMTVSVKWFYHPQEITSLSKAPKYKCGLFKSEHEDENSAQTIKHRCQVLTHEEYTQRNGHLRSTAERNKYDIFYVAGSYDAGKGKIVKIFV